MVPNCQVNQANVPTASAMAMSTRTRSQGCAFAASKPPRKIANLLKNRFIGGTPAMASAATAKPKPTTGMRVITPLRRGIMRVPAE